MKSISFLEENGINIKKCMDLFGDINKYNENIGTFLVGVHKNVNKVIELMQNKDLVNYAIYAHSIKTDARYFGFENLAKKAEIHELKAKEGDLYFITSNINDLIEEANHVIILVQQYMNGNEQSERIQIKDDNILNKKTILVVDDSNIVRNFVKKIFSETYNVGVAKDGKEAIEIIEANKDNNYIETVLLDLNMPKVNGFKVLEYMRDNNLLEKMPVSIISGDSTKETIDKAFTYDIVDMIGKPFNNNSIKQIVEKTILYKNEKM